jgi:predicted transcriptional regulator
VPRTTPVRQIMTTDVVTLDPSDTVEAAARILTERGIGGAPVVDADGRVVGLLEDDDLIVQDAKLHFPTVISVLGAYIELPSAQRQFEDELRKAVGATVVDVMDPDPPTCTEDDTLEEVATVMHEHNRSRLPVVRAGKLVGVISRGDIVRAIVRTER